MSNEMRTGSESVDSNQDQKREECRHDRNGWCINPDHPESRKNQVGADHRSAIDFGVVGRGGWGMEDESHKKDPLCKGNCELREPKQRIEKKE